MRRDESSDESTVISSQTSTLTRNRGPESMTGAECNIECGEDSASEDEESREPLNQIVEEDSFEDYIPEEEINLEEEYLPSTAEKETNTECNFCPEGARQLHRRKSQQVSTNQEESLATVKRSQTFSPQPQSIGKGHYICRLNRSESDSSMSQYARRALHPPTAPGIPFDRTLKERRSLRWGRVRGAAVRHSSTKRSARTSLDLSLDLKAHHSRLTDLRQEIAHLTLLKKRLEEACAKGDPTIAAWVAEDETLRRLISAPESSSNDRVSKLFQRTCKEIYRLRKSRQGGRKPDLVTFKEKMAFFTRTKSTVPTMPDDGNSEDDWEQDLEERSTPDGRSSKTSFEKTAPAQEPVECKNPCMPEANFDNELKISEEEEVRYDFVVDRVLGVQV